MADHLPFELSDGWALGTDNNQWMLMRGRTRHAESVWQPVAYIASTKTNPLPCMAEKGAHPPAAAQAQLDELSERFLGWRETSARKAVA